MRPTDQPVAPVNVNLQTREIKTSSAKRTWQPPVLSRLSVVDTTLMPKVDPSNDLTNFDS